MSRDRLSHFIAFCLTPGVAWLLLTVALAIHVVDEAVHDFLSTYNPIARGVRERFPLIPLPTFSFGAWLGGLIAGLVLLLALSPLAFRRAAWLSPLALVLSVLMAVNGGLHLAGSVYLGRVVPGTYSAPVLLIAALCLLVSAIRGWRVPARVEG